jgi:copper/silver efflux system protein
VAGRARYPVNIRYPRELRNDVDKLKRILVPVMTAARSNPAPSQAMTGSTGSLQVPLGELADFRVIRGATSIKSEEGLMASYVYIDVSGRDVGSYVDEARQKAATIKLPEGYRLVWSGEYEYILKTHERLRLIIPFTLLIIFVILFLNTRSVTKTAIVLLAVPFSLVGSFWLLYMLNYNMSIAVWVGIIALAGLDAETGVIMLLYLDLAYEKWKKEGKLTTKSELQDAIMFGAVKRIRPKMMTVSVILAGLIPILFSTGAGADVMKRIAAPMVGGVISSAILELMIYPAIYMIWRGRRLRDESASE